jgi:membrane-bound lytic murein transglycosylase D
MDAPKFAAVISFLFLSFTVSASTVDVSAFDENTPVNLDPLASQKSLSSARPWRVPDYSDQSSALGWKPNAFDVPKGMENQVRFWVDIYTRYNTWQGVIHDSENIDLVYEVVDFRDVEKLGLRGGQKEKLKRKLVEDAKRRATDTLRVVAAARSASELTPAQHRVWSYFDNLSGGSRIREAMNPSRIRFQLGQKDRMESAIFLSGRYLEDFEEIFRKNGLPIELTRLVFVESSFNVLARSKVGASGLWQLMPGTVKPYRIMSATVDGRNHPLTATEMASKILNSNYQRLESWPLALTGYNHGPSGVQRIVQRYGTRDLTNLIRDVRSSASFGFASRNFYASFLAAYHVEKNAPKYFPRVKWSQRLNKNEFRLPQAVKYADLQNWFNHNNTKLQIFNPHLTLKVRKGFAIPSGTIIGVPSERYNNVMMALGQRPVRQIRKVASPVRLSTKSRRIVKTTSAKRVAKKKIHRVSRGENPTLIAREYGVKLRDLLGANDLRLDDAILPGQRLLIPH